MTYSISTSCQLHSYFMVCCMSVRHYGYTSFLWQPHLLFWTSSRAAFGQIVMQRHVCCSLLCHFVSFFLLIDWYLITSSYLLLMHVESKGSCGKMFIPFRLHVVAVGRPLKDFATFVTTAYWITFPIHTYLVKSRTDIQGVCPGNDDTEEAPISWIVIKYALGNMGVFHQ